jgi:hypothetical protein
MPHKSPTLELCLTQFESKNSSNKGVVILLLSRLFFEPLSFFERNLLDVLSKLPYS